jgi:phosphohistidine swiveling domain-containing protein
VEHLEHGRPAAGHDGRGIPCVMGTGDGTRRVRDGDRVRVRVDGARGTLRVLEVAAGS